jgi:Holliday junction resolvase
MKEKDIVNRIKVHMTKRGAWVIKTHGSPHLAGIPDILACYEGRFMALEVKRPETRNTVTERQARFLQDITEAGGITAVVTSVEEAEACLLDVELWAGTR